MPLKSETRGRTHGRGARKETELVAGDPEYTPKSPPGNRGVAAMSGRTNSRPAPRPPAKPEPTLAEILRAARDPAAGAGAVRGARVVWASAWAACRPTAPASRSSTWRRRRRGARARPEASRRGRRVPVPASHSNCRGFLRWPDGATHMGGAQHPDTRTTPSFPTGHGQSDTHAKTLKRRQAEPVPRQGMPYETINHRRHHRDGEGAAAFPRGIRDVVHPLDVSRVRRPDACRATRARAVPLAPPRRRQGQPSMADVGRR